MDRKKSLKIFTEICLKDKKKDVEYYQKIIEMLEIVLEGYKRSLETLKQKEK